MDPEEQKTVFLSPLLFKEPSLSSLSHDGGTVFVVRLSFHLLLPNDIVPDVTISFLLAQERSLIKSSVIKIVVIKKVVLNSTTGNRFLWSRGIM